MTHYELTGNMLTTGEVASLLNVQPSTVVRWSNQKVIETYRINPQSERKFRREEIVNLFLKRAFGVMPRPVA